MTRSLLEWMMTQGPSHPARTALQMARCAPLGLDGRPEPVGVSAADPVLWLSAWAAGKVVRWERSGLAGWCGLSTTPREPVIPTPDAPALVWPLGGVERVYSHGAVYAAIQETSRLGVHGRGLWGPSAFVQGAASWLHALGFGAGGFWWPDPEGLGWVTDGSRRVRCLPELLGAFADIHEDAAATTRIEAGRRIRSRRLHDGVWTGREVTPAHFLYGWLPLRYSISEVS